MKPSAIEVVRQLRWPRGVRCPACDSSEIVKRGKHTHQTHRQRYACHACGRQFDDLIDTILEGHHQPLRTWVLCLYFMGLNLSNEQIAAELGLDATLSLYVVPILVAGHLEDLNGDLHNVTNINSCSIINNVS